MRRLVIISMGVLLAATLIFAGCTPTQPEVITLKYADQNPKIGWEGEHAMLPWIEAVEEATNGRVKFEIYDAETLMKGVDTWEGLKSGIADVAWCFHGYWPGLTPLADVMSLPVLEFENAEQASGIMWQLYEEYPSISEQFADNHVLLTWTSSPYFLITTNEQINTLEDLSGLQIRLTGGPPTDLAKKLNISPVSVGMPDTYADLQKGVLDGMMIPWEAIYTFRQYEVVKYYTYFPSYVVYFTQAVNLNTWNSLPEDIQKQIESVSGIEGSKFWGKNMFDTAEQGAKAIIMEKGYPLIETTLSDDEVAKLQELAEPLWEDWVNKMEAAEHSEARDILDTTLELIQTYQP